MARVLVLGAGFGGIAAATRLRSLLDPATRSCSSTAAPTSSWASARRGRSSAPIRSREARARSRPCASGASTSAGDGRGDRARRPPREPRRRVARGRCDRRRARREQAPEAVPGLAEHGINVWDRANAERARDALAALDRGRLLVGVFGTPYACPPGPFELALLANEALAARGADVSVEVFGPMPIALPVVGPVESAKVEALLEAAGIPFHRGQPATSVEAGVVHLADGRDLAFDLLLAVPPHRCAAGPRRRRPRPARRLGRGRSGRPSRRRSRASTRSATRPSSSSPTGCRCPRPACSRRPRANVVAERIAAELAGREPRRRSTAPASATPRPAAARRSRSARASTPTRPAADIAGPSAEPWSARRPSRPTAWRPGSAADHGRSDIDDARAAGEPGLIGRLVEAAGGRVGAQAVFAPSVERDGLTVIPVARVRWGAGGGRGWSPEQGGEGSARGGGAMADPVGYFEVTREAPRSAPSSGHGQAAAAPRGCRRDRARRPGAGEARPLLRCPQAAGRPCPSRKQADHFAGGTRCACDSGAALPTKAPEDAEEDGRHAIAYQASVSTTLVSGPGIRPGAPVPAQLTAGPSGPRAPSLPLKVA